MSSPENPAAALRRVSPEKICVAIAGATLEELTGRSAALLSEFPFQELRLDYLPEPAVAIPALRSYIQSSGSGTFLATCRREASGGRFAGSAEAELRILLEAAGAGCALVDLSLESAEALGSDAVKMLRSSGAAVILSWHDFERTGDLRAVLERMRPFAPDICKIVPTASSLIDNLPLLRLLEDSRAAGQAGLVGLSMGEAGVLSRVLGVRSGSAFTFAASEADKGTAPGQVSAEVLRGLYRIEDLDPATAIFGVAGHPIRSSLSPVMLNTAFARRSKNAVYVPLLTNDARELFEMARFLPLAGFSVTMPLKQTVVPLLDDVDPLAARIGAVNTIRRAPDGRFEGFNTDAAGIVVPLQSRLDLRRARVLVLGAGGAARAAAFGCADAGAAVSISSRRPEQAAQLATEAGAAAILRDQLPHLPEFDVLINATPAGMRGNATELPLPPEELRARLVFDLVYNPLETPLIRAARDRGIETINGVEMFVHQGARQFELWMGEAAPVDAMREAVLAALA